MNSQELRALQEAYLKVVENQQLDEISPEFVLAASKAADKKGKPAQASRLYKKFAARDQAANYAGYQRRSVNNEEVEIYDVILSHLLDEGYADTEQAAEAIMVNMSEDWRESIMEADSLAAMAARREKRLKAQRKREGTSATGQDWGHNYGQTAAQRESDKKAEFDAFIKRKK